MLEQWDDLPARGQARDVYVAALANICDAEIQLARLDEALAVCSRFTTLFLDNAVGFYNLAGVYAMLDRTDEALAALRRDMELGDTDWEYLEEDRWFEAMRENPGFVESWKR